MKHLELFSLHIARRKKAVLATEMGEHSYISRIGQTTAVTAFIPTSNYMYNKCVYHLLDSVFFNLSHYLIHLFTLLFFYSRNPLKYQISI